MSRRQGQRPTLGDFIEVATKRYGARQTSATARRGGRREDVAYLCRDNLIVVIPWGMKEGDELTKRVFNSWCRTLGIPETEFYR